MLHSLSPEVNQSPSLLVFSAKLRGHQHSWIPCDVEALSIASAVKHFSPYVIQSHLQTCVLTDNKPCVQAYEKLSRGEFSSSARVSTFLTTVKSLPGFRVLP